LILFTFISNVSYAATIRMNNGDIVEGDVVERSESEIKVDNGTGIAISYYLDEIESIDGENPQKYSSGLQTIKQHYYCGIRNLINVKDGMKHGIQRSYYKNGKVYKEENYENGKINDLAKVYDAYGNILEESNYVNGRKEGVTRLYYEDGTIKNEINFKYGIETGLCKAYYKDGSLMTEENFEDNESTLKIFDKNGTMIGSFYTEDGKLFHENGKIFNGRQTVKYSNGNKFLEEEFNDGILNGSSTAFYETGNIKIAGNYEDNEPVGAFKIYNEEGRIEKEENYEAKKGKTYEKSYYKNGKLKEEIYYNDRFVHKIYDENGEVLFEE
ncbi:MAG: toxin-antitoxin system YwqK family antitoxin, partial [Candidatus Omnitrophica bacterium]|nr:toxin-antitoxin system YwqK family antitoxin [Candidatus Omnitrophota bacterium]